MGDLLSIFAALTTLAIVAVLANSGNTAGDIGAVANGYATAVTAAGHA